MGCAELHLRLSKVKCMSTDLLQPSLAGGSFHNSPD